MIDRLGLPGLVIAAALVMVGAGGSSHAEERPRVVTSFSVLEDMARQVAGDLADVSSLTPVGAEVHEYELQPSDFVRIEEADLVLYNGYMLEQWMDQLEATVRDTVPVISVAERTARATIPIRIGEFEGDPDPHLWMDPAAAIEYVNVIAAALGELMPDHEQAFRENAAEYLAEIEAAADEARELLDAVPENQRLLITSEAAFLYFADAFGWRHDGIWGSNAEIEGSPSQIRRIVDLINETRPRAIFYESTITDRYVRAIAEDTGVAVHGSLFVDSLGGQGTGAESYPDMLRTNARLIAEALGGERAEARTE